MKRFISIALFLAVELAAPWANAQELELTDRLLREISWPAVMGVSSELKPEPGESPARIALKEYHNSAIKDLRVNYVAWLEDRGGIREVLDGVDRLFAARIELSSPENGKSELLQDKLALAKFIERQAEEIKVNPADRPNPPLAFYQYLHRTNLKAAVAYRNQVNAEIDKVTAAMVGEQKEAISLAPLFK